MIATSIKTLRWLSFGLGYFFFACSSPAPPHFKVLTEGDAVYRVAFEDLPNSMVDGKRLPMAKMGLYHGETAIPIWLNNDDNHFGPGDYFEFLAKRLPGNLTYYHEYARRNAYRLRFDSANPSRANHIIAEPLDEADASASSYLGFRHYERDKLLMRFASYDFQPHEMWYWQKLSCTDRQPFEFSFQLGDRNPMAKAFQIRLNLRGWSRIRGKGLDHLPDHELVIGLNQKDVGTFHWDEREPHELVINVTDLADLETNEYVLSLAIPRRNLPNGDLAIDVVLLNWVEVHYTQSSALGKDSKTFRFEAKQDHSPNWLQTQAQEQTLMGDRGTRITVPGSATATHFTHPNLGEDTYFVAAGTQTRPAPRIVGWLPGDLANNTQQADYLMITHPRLKAAIQPLAKYHREQGKTVKVVDIRHIYNSFNQGIVHPSAIKAFIANAYHHWQKPSPQFVLLVGDASWDTKNRQVRDKYYSDGTNPRSNATSWSKIRSTAYDEKSKENHRNLIPTSNFFDSTGHSASDNYFVTVDGDDIYPDLAIGRLPVTRPDEVTQIITKTIAYDQAAPVGPWRRKILMITNEEEIYQRRTDKLAREFLAKDRTVEKIYPASRDKSNAHHTQGIIDAMNQGQNLIYFYGHGGRFIWRTGPPDIKKNHDLFTLDDLDTLAPNSRLPIVLSLTCYSAPFDHPSADSIGEKFLRLENRGAIAFVGASWRNAPKFSLSKALLKSFTSQATIGEALVQGKRDIKNKTLVQTYNLLGDPAIKLLPRPQSFALKLMAEDQDSWTLQGQATEISFLGKGLGEVKYQDGTVGQAVDFAVSGNTFQIRISKPTNSSSPIFGWQVYLWDEASGQDWLALLAVTPAPDTLQDRATAAQP